MKSASKPSENSVITAIAIDRDKNSQYAVRWAVDNLISYNSPQCILLHVRSQSLHPEDFDGATKEGRPPTKDELQQFFLPYRGFCARKGIVAKEVILHDIDIPSALICYALSNCIGNIVVGASTRNTFMRKFRNSDVPSTVLKAAPENCSVYVIASKGKVQSSKIASQPQTPMDSFTAPPFRQRSQKGLFADYSQESANSLDMNRSVVSCDSWRSEVSDMYSNVSDHSQVTPFGNFRSYFTKVSPRQSTDSHTSDSFNVKPLSDRSDYSSPPSCSLIDASGNLHFSSASKSSSSSSSSQNHGSMDAELQRLRQELKNSMQAYNSIQTYNSAGKETVAGKEKSINYQQWKTEEARKLEEARQAEEAALTLLEVERQKAKVAQRMADLELQKRMNEEKKAKQEAEEKQRTMEELSSLNVMYRKYSIQDIEIATDDFSDSLKIGEGGYGPVYKGTLDHTAVAIKVLRADLSQGLKQFKQEVEVLGSMRHPNMVLLLGACPEYGCLVYEYMDYGSLEDRLFRKDDTPTIPWRTRFKIAAEIGTALLFLHQNKPEPLVHRDLKPANILIDKNYVSKIGDVGLARLVPSSVADCVTQYHMTAAAGTFCYIDPEYQQTGMLGVKSDLYSFGVMLLQIITARSAMGLSHQVENAIEKGKFSEILDPTVTDWPVEEALSLAKLALQCCELRKRDRPDLASVLLPELIRLRDFGLESEAWNNNRTAVEPRPYNSVPEMQTDSNQETILMSKWKFNVDQCEKTMAAVEVQDQNVGMPDYKQTNQTTSTCCWKTTIWEKTRQAAE
ncbi:hypothetical protein JRO89_XS09G0222800 [Xanthoceras sorbifolium]|uniref:RING-type E3 ubiquitin transferase n=1 Tax=Xanthoceras sorbifolium TaxID=99658 RepID=A0ABQ8HMF1_9ROSI|nr:hypothetical protein JRO89_XS09G0222800 [Xanthoceras sorbifolium]